uniref:Uncharacterized protein n=1 Tax=Rhizophora mucronata TaxID=61149 RepID=A0A2P2QC63_RHIMU
MIVFIIDSQRIL